MMRLVKSLKIEGQRSLCFLSLLVAVPFLSGCSQEMEKREQASEPVLSQQFRQESVTVIISVSETNIPTSGNIVLMADVHAPGETEVVFPEIGTLITPFSVADGYTEPEQLLPNGKYLQRRVWVLVPSLPGEVVFQPLEILAGSRTVKTEPIKVSVRSLLPQGLETLEIKDIAAPAALLPEQKKQQRRWSLIAGTVGLVVFLVFLIKFARRPKKVVIIPPYEAALQALENLPDEPLARLHEIRRILLTFIEPVFNIPTTGKTSGEIIPLIPKFPLLGRRIPLVEFMNTSELVLFSNQLPAGYVEESEQYVRNFLDEMKEEGLCD